MLKNIEKIIVEKIKDIGKVSNNYLLVKYYDNKGFTKQMSDNIKYDDKHIYLYYEFSGSKISEAYEPFLTWIKDIFQKYVDISLDEFFEECNIYIPHRFLLKSYFKTGVAKRKEFLLINELDFEVKRFNQGILNMLMYIEKIRPVIIIFNKLQFAGVSTMKFICEIFSGDEIGNLSIIAFFNDKISIIKEKEKIWNELLDHFIDLNCIYDWDEEDLIENFENEYEITNFKSHELESIMLKIENICNLLALHQASYYLGILYHKYEVDNYEISAELKFKIYKCYTKNCIAMGKISDAYEVINKLRLLVTDDEKKYEYYEQKIFLELMSEKYEKAKETLCKAKKLVENDDKEKKLLLQIMKHMADYSCWNGVWFYKDLLEDEMTIIENCEKYNYRNFLAHIYIYAFDNDSSLYYKVDGLESRLKFFSKGIMIAKEMNNEHLLLDAYHKALLIASSNGYIDVSDYLYREKCMPICKKNNDLNEEAMSYIGLGYNRCASEEYDKANEYFNKALIIYYRFEDIGFMNEILYNMTINAIMSEDYKSANSYITSCLAAMENQKNSSKLRICHVAKLNGLKALCCYRLGNIYKCKIYLSNTKRMIDFVLSTPEEEKTYYYWSDDLFLYFFIKGMLLRDSEKYEEAEDHLDKALFYSTSFDGTLFFSYTQCMIEKAKLYMLIGKKDSAVYALEQAIHYCEDNKFKKQRLKVLLAMCEIIQENRLTDADINTMNNVQLQWENGSLELSLKGITLNNIMQVIKNIGIYNRSIEEKERVQFLSKWTKIINSPGNLADDIIKDSIKTFKNNFGVDNCIFIKNENGKLDVKFSEVDIEITDDKLDKIYDYVVKNPLEFAVSKMDANFYDYEEIMSVFGSARIASIMIIPIIINEEVEYIAIMYMLMRNTWYSSLNKYMLNNDALSLFASSFHQLVEAIEREKIHAELRDMNFRLQEMALKDNLTRLYNRQGLQYSINQMVSKTNKKVCAILYMDLDNFKYYNDNFGHEVGDLILVAFANVIENICGEDGFAVRYGGDEFLIVLYLDEASEAEDAAKSIYQTIEKEDGFKGLVEETVGHKVEISKSNRVSCSIGVSSMDNINEKNAFEIALKKADDALYYIKRTKKGRYEVWDNIKEFL